MNSLLFIPELLIMLTFFLHPESQAFTESCTRGGQTQVHVGRMVLRGEVTETPGQNSRF